ncbi:MAG: type II secretion system F family protein [Actinomycetota bacterium]
MRAVGEHGDTAAAVRVLAALLRSGLTIDQTLDAWPETAPDDLRPSLRRLRRRVALGQELGRALDRLEDELGPDVRLVKAVLVVHGRVGGDGARSLESVADQIQRRAERQAAARAASAGARLSARLVAGLPLALVPVMPFARALVLDASGLFVLLTGAGLALAGMRWMAKLVPRPPEADGGALLGRLVASVVRGGVEPGAALNAACESTPGDLVEAMARARRAVTLGARWPDALMRSSSDSLRGLGAALKRSDEFGVPVADALDAFAEERDAQQDREHETALRRAPVLMVVPLTVCVLPAYVLLGVVPFLRGLASA